MLMLAIVKVVVATLLQMAGAEVGEEGGDGEGDADRVPCNRQNAAGLVGEEGEGAVEMSHEVQSMLPWSILV